MRGSQQNVHQLYAEVPSDMCSLTFPLVLGVVANGPDWVPALPLSRVL